MSVIHNGRISMQYAEAFGQHPSPSDPLPDHHREHSDSASDDDEDDEEDDIKQEGCFITNQTAPHLKLTHWIKPARNNRRLNHELERTLRELCIVPLEFRLDQPANLVPLDPNIHHALKLGLFAITCSKPTLLSFITLVEQENQTWQKRYDRDWRYYRYFNYAKPPYQNATYELVLLHPHEFMQKTGGALTVFSRPESGEALSLSGKKYVLSPDGALREGPENDKPRLPAFTSKSRAFDLTVIVNPLLVILNADMAFRRFKSLYDYKMLCEEYQELIDLTIELVDKLYYDPLMARNLEIREEERAYFALKAAAAASATSKAQKASNSRMGVVVSPPGPDATHEQIVEYKQYLMSGCDQQSNEDSEEEVNYWDDEEDEEDHAPTRASDVLDAQLPPPLEATEKVQQWLDEV